MDGKIYLRTRSVLTGVIIIHLLANNMKRRKRTDIDFVDNR